MHLSGGLIFKFALDGPSFAFLDMFEAVHDKSIITQQKCLFWGVLAHVWFFCFQNEMIKDIAHETSFHLFHVRSLSAQNIAYLGALSRF